MVFSKYNILVDLICNHQNIVLFADSKHMIQFFLCPYSSCRIMWGTHKEQFHIIFCDRLLNCVIIHGEIAIFIF